MAGRSKGLEKFDRNGVVQHRNHVCEIALKKRISTFQKEGKMLEKELREISKVRETLRQIRAPLRRKVLEDAMQEQERGNDESRNSRAVRTRKVNMISADGMQEKYNNNNNNNNKKVIGQRRESAYRERSVESQERVRSKTSCSGLLARPRETNSARSAPHEVPLRRKKLSVYESPVTHTESGEAEKLRRRKISAPVYCGMKSPNIPRISKEECLSDGSRNGFLPPISPNTSPRTNRRSPLLEITSSVGSDDEDGRKSHARSFLSPSRAESLWYSRDMNLTTSRGRSTTDPEDEKTLTMEETLRIKGKFRQIGHSIIATALLKGLKQKGQLTSEAIHNLHQPISLNSGKEKGEEEGSESEERKDENEEGKEEEKNSKFRAIARKTINVNRLVGGQLSRRRSQSDPSSNTKAHKSETNVEEQGKGESASNSEDREDGGGEEQEQQPEETVKASVGNPLMNAHIARRRKFGVVGHTALAGRMFARERSVSAVDCGDSPENSTSNEAKAEARILQHSQLLSPSVDSEPTENSEHDDLGSRQMSANVKTVRFKLDAWE